jgi:chromosome segregation ATPase
MRSNMTEIEALKATIVEARTGIGQLKQVLATLEGREREELHQHIQLMEEHLKDAQNALSKMEKHAAAVDVAKEAAHVLLRPPLLRSHEPPLR